MRRAAISTGCLHPTQAVICTVLPNALRILLSTNDAVLVRVQGIALLAPRVLPSRVGNVFHILTLKRSKQSASWVYGLPLSGAIRFNVHETRGNKHGMFTPDTAHGVPCAVKQTLCFVAIFSDSSGVFHRRRNFFIQFSRFGVKVVPAARPFLTPLLYHTLHLLTSPFLNFFKGICAALPGARPVLGVPFPFRHY